MNQDYFIPGLELIQLTDDDSNTYNYNEEEEDDQIEWMDDYETQENLFQIIPLMPEETCCDKDNHIIASTKIFFEELGYVCDEPEPLDPTRDYEAEYRQRTESLQQQLNNNNRRRQRHVDLASIPTIDASPSPGLSSTCSSFHHTDDDHYDEEQDVRSPLYMGRVSPLNHHSSLKPISSSSISPHHPHFSFSSNRF
ncbi:uncharacterized protein BX664DRAFT_335941 [Halteromyces radiatus]|uniref:uncharacterized protein n=1 Tax=Halteromyces radiatus TaxID=101107 RepID=UPI00221FBBAF|nr:uncharacterized protein BX664DRAFT_335941 [Halteromyces radiatus]KAI8086493.1 hypothetical protein BX664DRAFT_335941 [Halteromyces radiatus]